MHLPFDFTSHPLAALYAKHLECWFSKFLFFFSFISFFLQISKIRIILLLFHNFSLFIFLSDSQVFESVSVIPSNVIKLGLEKRMQEFLWTTLSLEELGRKGWKSKRKRSRGISCGFECIWILKLRRIGERKKEEIFRLFLYIRLSYL